MPNYCYNSLMVNGDRDELDAFYARTIDNKANEVRLLNTFLPMSEYHKTQEGYNDGGYEWCIDTWGTKWPEGDMEVDDFPNAINMRFCTAWSPPVDGIKAIAKMFPTLEFVMEWSEDGMGFIGASYHKSDIEVIMDEEIDAPEFDDDPYYEQQSEWVANRRDELGLMVLDQGRNA